jgi:antibiotic biosynthesis monooxygenase (ABM) superfamily enzyme
MATNRVVNIVATECPAEDEDRFNEWYNEVHIPMLLSYKGLTRIGRYRLIGEGDEHARYLAIYEFDSQESLDNYHTSPELAAAMEEMQESWKDDVVKIKWMAAYETIKTWE